ncbi:MAG: hypothetical protein U1F00_03410 [Rhodoferax sp.]
MQAIHPSAILAPRVTTLPVGLAGALRRWLGAVFAVRRHARVAVPSGLDLSALDLSTRRDVGLPQRRMSSREHAARLLARSGPLL